MYRITGSYGKYYAVEIAGLRSSREVEDIEAFVIESAEPVLLVQDIEDAERFGIDADEIEIVERDEN